MSDHEEPETKPELPPKPEAPQNHDVKGGTDRPRTITLIDKSGKKEA